jgi:hypothetical protein
MARRARAGSWWVAEPIAHGAANESRWALKNASGGVEGFLSKFANTRTDTHPFKVWGRTYQGVPAFGTYHGAVYGTLAQAVKAAEEVLAGRMKLNPGASSSVLDALRAAGVAIETHESDVYVPVTPEATRIIAAHGVKGVTMFRSEGRNWYDLPFQNTEFFAAKAKRNPPLAVFGNPAKRNPSEDPWARTFRRVTGKVLGSRGAKVLSKRAISIRYVHVADGQRYEHKFGKDDVIELLPDGSFRIYNRQGKNLWKDFL